MFCINSSFFPNESKGEIFRVNSSSRTKSQLLGRYIFAWCNYIPRYYENITKWLFFDNFSEYSMINMLVEYSTTLEIAKFFFDENLNLKQNQNWFIDVFSFNASLSQDTLKKRQNKFFLTISQNILW